MENEKLVEELIKHIRELTSEHVSEMLTLKEDNLQTALNNIELILLNLTKDKLLADAAQIPEPTSMDTIKFLELALDFVKSIIPLTREQEGEFVLKIGKKYSDFGDWDNALKYFEQATQIAQEVGNIQLKADAYSRIGYIQAQLSEWDASEEACKQSLELFEQLGDKNEISRIYYYMGSNYFRMGDFEKATEYYDKALEIAQEFKNARIIALANLSLGAISDAQGDLDRAVAYYQQSIPRFEQADDAHGLAGMYHNLGITYAKRSDWEDAGECYEKCLELARDYGYTHLLAAVYMNKAEFYFKLHDTLMAKTYCGKALEMFEEMKDKRGIVNTYKLFGMILRNAKDWEESARFFRVAIRICKEINDIHTEAEIHYEFGIMYQNMDDRVKALEHLRQSHQLYEQLAASERAEMVRQRISELE